MLCRFQDLDGKCDVCLLGDREHVLMVDSSDGEYGSGRICLDCLRHVVELAGSRYNDDGRARWLGPVVGQLRWDGPRYEAWRQVFGGDLRGCARRVVVPLRSPVPVHGIGPDGTAMRFLHVDVERLTPEQMARVVEHLSTKFGIPAAEVERDLRDPAHGLPILADDVTVFFDARLVL